MTEWDIQSRSSACTVCGTEFGDKEIYHTLLRFEPAGYSRQDLCANCAGKVSRQGVVSYWQGEFRVPPPPAPEPIQKETAETMLRKLIESKDPSHAATRYILAVMLERKRLLKHRDTIRDEAGTETLVYEHSLSGETFAVPDPRLRLDQLEEVQGQVTALLERGLSASEQQEEAGPAPEPAPEKQADKEV